MYAATRDWLFHRPIEHTLGEFAAAEGAPCNLSATAIRRIATAYTDAVDTDLGDRGIDWLGMYGTMKADIHEALVSGSHEEICAFLANPASNMMFYGFENTYNGQVEQSEGHHRIQSHFIYNSLLRVAEATGVVRMEDPEPYDLTGDPPTPLLVEDILLKLDDALGFRIDFPNPYPNEVGYPTSRGIASYRAVQALYQVWRIMQLAGGRHRSVVEIGAGLGRNAYYARRAGLDRYTIVDIPMTSAAQAYFLARTLGEDAIQVYGESNNAPIRILPPEDFLRSAERYDLIVNIDSLPEMDAAVSKRYFDHIARRTPTFLSINHEILPITVRNYYVECRNFRFERQPYWLRRGYVEEVVRFL
ncbi:putative sugar O-methyltransferase [Methylobacterium sp. BTF04]|uniref:putative sugar O-methyltransferase n=1 Tax=Methylobacterium sp. BTF04 TaxID=2708300 RepID=UPI0013D2B6E4|nr:putative sugar O-methyltransferase [Methylobacterium sp. BTF04]NEU13216.1 putative sugar O-methyltransferase [Methylobacterium sp. BTF04]